VQDRVAIGALTTIVYLFAQTVDGSSVGLNVDTIEVVPYTSFVKFLHLTMPVGRSLIYDQTAQAGGFCYPRQSPAAYMVLFSDGRYQTPVRRYGTLAPIAPAQTSWFWIQGQGAALHTLTDTADVSLLYLARYSLGLRGAA
jgi:hypothetical protein